jgi:hypothetical protein
MKSNLKLFAIATTFITLALILTPQWLEASRLYTSKNNHRYTRKRPKELNERDSSHHVSMREGDIIIYRDYEITLEDVTGPPRKNVALDASQLSAIFHVKHLNPAERIDQEVTVSMQRFGLVGLIQIEVEDLKRSSSGSGSGDFYIKWRGAR